MRRGGEERRGGGEEGPGGGPEPRRGVGERLRAGGRRKRPVRAAVTQPGSGGHDSGVAKVTSRPLRLPAPGAAAILPQEIPAPPARAHRSPPEPNGRSPGLARVLLHLRTRRRPLPPRRPAIGPSPPPPRADQSEKRAGRRMSERRVRRALLATPPEGGGQRAVLMPASDRPSRCDPTWALGRADGHRAVISGSAEDVGLRERGLTAVHHPAPQHPAPSSSEVLNCANEA